jgi:hypothetical protein
MAEFDERVALPLDDEKWHMSGHGVRGMSAWPHKSGDWSL